MAKKALTNSYRRPGYYIVRSGEWLESPAYRELSPLARCLLEEFQIKYRDGNNGRIGMSVGYAARRLNCTTKTVGLAFRQLIDHGFIDVSLQASYKNGKAREWTLLIHPGPSGREALDTWRYWQKPINEK